MDEGHGGLCHLYDGFTGNDLFGRRGFARVFWGDSSGSHTCLSGGEFVAYILCFAYRKSYHSVSGFHLLDCVAAANTAGLSGRLWPDGAKLQSVLPVDFIPGGFAVFRLFALDERDVSAGTGGRIRLSATGHLILRRIPAQTDSVKVHRDRAASESIRWRLIFYLQPIQKHGIDSLLLKWYHKVMQSGR